MWKRLFALSSVAPDDAYLLYVPSKISNLASVCVQLHRPTLYTAMLAAGFSNVSRPFMRHLGVDLHGWRGYLAAAAGLVIACAIGKAIEIGTRKARSRSRDLRIHEDRGPRVMNLTLQVVAFLAGQALFVGEVWNAATCMLLVCLVGTVAHEILYVVYGRHHLINGDGGPRRHRVRKP